MQRVFAFISIIPKWVFLPLIVLLLLGGGYWYTISNDQNGTERFTVQRTTLRQEVLVTGQVKPDQEANLSFERTGKLIEVLVDTGTQVIAGDVLMRVDSSDLNAQLQQAQGSLESAQAQYQAALAELESAKSEVLSAQAGVDNERSQLLQLNSALEAAQQELKELQIGTRAEEIRIAETKVSNAENEVADLKIDLINVQQTSEQELQALLEEGRNIVQEAAVTGKKLLSENLLEIMYPVRYPINETCQAQVSAFVQISSTACFDALNSVEQLESLSESLKSDDSLSLQMVQDDLSFAKQSLIKVRFLLAEALRLADSALAFDEDQPSAFTEQQLIALKAPITSGQLSAETALQKITSIQERIQTKVLTNQSTLQSAENLLNRAMDALSSAKNDLELKIAGPTAEQIAAQEARVRQAEANIASQEAKIRQAENAPSAQQSKITLAQANLSGQAARIKQERANIAEIQAQIEKTILKAPFDGIVTTQNGEVGEIVAANDMMVKIISGGEFEIEANIPEIDIAKVKLNDQADVTLDAYGDEVHFSAYVKEIDPAETIVDDVTNYMVTFQFDQPDERIRSGMTANISLLTKEWKDVLAVPEYALVKNSDGVFVHRLLSQVNGEHTTELVPVSIDGLSTDGFRVVESGLEEGDVIVITLE